jgi:Formin Homology 2 Domain/Subunit CCDC53 of WASH complex
MVGRLFGSPSGQGGNATPVQPLNTPKSSQSRRERIEQARQDRSRRRNFGFLKTGHNEKKVVSTTALTRRREHAKQLANLAYSEEPAGSTDYPKNHDKLTPTSRSARQQLLSSFDIDSPQNVAHAPLDPFFSNDTATISGLKHNKRADNPLFFDPHNVISAGSTGVASDREPTASTVDTFDNSSLGSTAFDMDFIAASHAATMSHQSPMASSARNASNRGSTTNTLSASRQRGNHSKMSLDNFFVESSDRQTVSMPTIPSNSTMQANNHRPNQYAAASSGGSVASAQSNSGSIGAAARRRMRSHMRSQGGGNASSNSSVGSSSANNPLVDAHSGDSNDASSLFFVPESPASSARSGSFQRNNNNNNMSSSKNRLAAYQQRSHGSNLHQRSPSFVSAGGNSVTSSNNSASSPGIFDSDNMDGGFTFDAFGLDQSQVEREVNEAMQDLAGQGISGFSMFVDKQTPSKKTGTSFGHNKDASFANQSDDDTFTPQNWDSSPLSSRNASPVPSHYYSNSDGGESFVDGFRVKPVTKQTRDTLQTSAKLSQFSSPTTSSSVTRRLQRSLKRGGSTGIQKQNTINEMESEYPPRWEASPQHFQTTPSPSTSRPSSSPQMSVFQDPVVTNPWKEDPWASDDGNGGNGSDFFSAGDTQSDVQDYRGSYGSAATGSSSRRLTSYLDAKSDVGVSIASRFSHANFYQLPPEELRPSKSSYMTGDDDPDDDSDDSDAITQMQEDMTREFAMDFVRRMSPSNKPSLAEPTNRKLHFNGASVLVKQIESTKEDVGEEAKTPSIRSRHSYRSRLFRDSQHRDDDNQNAPLSENNSSSVAINATSKVDIDSTTGNDLKAANKTRFGDFRSKYESRTRANLVDGSESPGVSRFTGSDTADHNQEFANETESLPSLAVCTKKSHGDATASADPCEDSQPSQATNSRSSNDNHSFQGVAGWEQSRIHRRSSVEDGNGMEEKKDEDDSPHLKVPPQPKVGSLKAKWEAQSRAQVSAEKSTPAKAKEYVQHSGKAKDRIGKIDNAFEMLTPAIVEARRQEKQRNRSEHLRKSMGVVDDGKMFSSRSEVGASHGSTVADRILNRVRRESPRGSIPPAQVNDTKSDGGSTPSFLANVKLRKVTTPHVTNEDEIGNDENETMPWASKTSITYRERTVDSFQAEVESSNQVPVNNSIERPVERKLTYRERREMELRHEKEEKAKLELASQETPKKDVASLIRKRIAANKQRCAPTTNESPSEDLSNIHGRLKQVQDSNNLNETTNCETHPSYVDPAFSANKSPIEVASLLNSAVGSLEQSSPSSSRQAVLQATPLRISPEQSTGGNAGERHVYSPRRTDTLASPMKSPSKTLEQFLAGREGFKPPLEKERSAPSVSAASAAAAAVPDVPRKVDVPDDVSPADVKSMLSSFLGSRAPPALPLPTKENDTEALKKHHVKSPTSTPPKQNEDSPPPPLPPSYKATGSRPALKDDPKFERYFRMLKMGLPLEVAKHAMVRDGMDPSVLDLDPDKPIGIPLKEDPKFEKYFKMLKIGISMDQVKHAMESDGFNPAIMDQDHSLPVMAVEKREEKKEKETHRRARLHWKTIGKVVRNSLWAKVESEVSDIDIDEEEFNELFKADLKGESKVSKSVSNNKKKGAAVRVIDAKRANNGGIILARLKMTHDEMADAVDRIDSDVLSAEQIENIIEYLPTKEEREALEKYMLEGGQDAAEKFDGLCECEKFMVSMMTVKHAKRKIRALLFKLQFMSCMESIAEDAQTIDNACDELSHSNRLRQLLGIILQFGNRLNTAGVNSKGKAGAFTLDSLLKLKEAKAFDKKTTFLHYIILIVQRNNELLLKYYDDLPTVLKADKVFWDQCLQDLEEVENQLENVRRISLYEAKQKKQFKLRKAADPNDDDDSLGDMELSLEEEVESLRSTPSGVFTLGAIKQVSALRDKIDRTKAKFVRVLEYFGEDTRKMQPHELFSIISVFTRDFLKAKEEVFSNVHKRLREDRKKARSKPPNQKHGLPPPGPDRASSKPMLRASDHQPNMSTIFNEIQERGTLSPSSPMKNGTIMTSTPAISPSEPSSYNRMSYQYNVSNDSATSSSSLVAKEMLRQNAARRQQHDDGDRNASSERSPNLALAPQIGSTLKNVGSGSSVLGSMPPQPTARSPRDALRNRRRLEAMRARNGQQYT